MILVHWLVSDLGTGQRLGDIVSDRHDLPKAYSVAASQFGREAADLTVVERDMLSARAVAAAEETPRATPRKKKR